MTFLNKYCPYCMNKVNQYSYEIIDGNKYHIKCADKMKKQKEYKVDDYIHNLQGREK